MYEYIFFDRACSVIDGKTHAGIERRYTMELKLDKEPVLLTETVYDGQTEQGVELEYVLPDYYPDVFKLLKCTLTPRVVSYSVSDNKLFIDGVVYVKVLYLSDGSSDINVVDQRYTYSKTIDLSREIREPQVSIFPTADYCTARAVSGRKLDIRGAVTLKIKVSGVYETQLLCGAQGMGTEVSTENVSICEDRLYGGTQYIVREDIETGAGGGIISILSSECTATVTDTKIITDKVVVKGDAKIRALYLIKNSSGETAAESMEASVPLSRIIDLVGVNDSYNTFADLDVMDFSLEIRQDDSGENRAFGCEITVDCKVCAYKEVQIKLVNDLYSTKYETSYTVTPVRIDGLPRLVSLQYPVRTDIEYTDGAIAKIYDACCEVVGITPATDDNDKTRLSIRLNYRIIGAAEDGMPIVLDKTDSIEADTDIASDESFISLPDSSVTGISFGITGDNSAEIRAQVNISGLVGRVITINAVNEITVNEDSPKKTDTEYALRLYFADGNEKVWDISKRYNTSAAAIIAENDLDSETDSVSGMVLIPIV